MWPSSCSALLPLHEGLIVTTDREEVFVVSSGEHDTHDVLRVTTEASGETTLSCRVAEQVDKTVVVTGG